MSIKTRFGTINFHDTQPTNPVTVYQVQSKSELDLKSQAQYGDIGIVKTRIATVQTVDKYKVTAYIYTGKNIPYDSQYWTATDGNYTAEDIYFTEDLTMTYDFGKYEAKGKSVTVPAANKNLKELLLDAFSEEIEPIITKPRISLSLNDTTDSVEIGTNFSKSLTVTATYYNGTYSYSYVGSKNGDTSSHNALINYNINNDKTTDTSTSNKLTTIYTVDKIDETHSITFTGNASYAASDKIPVTNLNNPRENQKIDAGITSNKTATFTVNVFRYSFKYVGANLEAIDNNWIRTNAQKTRENLKSLSLNIPEGTKRIVVALEGSHTLQKVVDVKGMGLDVKETFTTTSLNIEGANSYQAVSYTIFVKENINGLAATVYNFTIV